MFGFNLHLRRMETSSYFEQTVFCKQSPTADQFFDSRDSQLFELTGDRSFVEVHVHLSSLFRAPDENTCSESIRTCDLSSDDESVSESTTPVDCCRYLKPSPPPYIDAPGLQLQKISDPEELRKFASVKVSVTSWIRKGLMGFDMKTSKDCFRIWFVNESCLLSHHM